MSVWPPGQERWKLWQWEVILNTSETACVERVEAVPSGKYEYATFPSFYCISQVILPPEVCFFIYKTERITPISPVSVWMKGAKACTWPLCGGQVLGPHTHLCPFFAFLPVTLSNPDTSLRKLPTHRVHMKFFWSCYIFIQLTFFPSHTVLLLWSLKEKSGSQWFTFRWQFLDQQMNINEENVYFHDFWLGSRTASLNEVRQLCLLDWAPKSA